MSVRVAAVDLGASSGRVMRADVGPDRLELAEVSRFPNEPVQIGQTLHWDILRLYAAVVDGLRSAGPIDGLGIDSWAVDYGLIDSTGSLVGNPVCYRDARTAGVMERVLSSLDASSVYATTGIQNLPFNTIHQLVAAKDTPQFAVAHRMLLLPDLLAYWLTGREGAEITNASSTQLLDARSREWAWDLVDRLGLPRGLFPPLRQPGDHIGPVAVTGLDAVPVIAVGSHDTASAVVGVPAGSDRFAYVSCGTWSLVGVELPAPVLSPASRRANFTNEIGVDGTVRYLRNVMGLWLLQESLRAWGRSDLDDLLAAAAREPALSVVVDPDDPSFLPPGDMPARIAAACRATGQPPPASAAATVRCIVDSLALAHRRAVRTAVELSGHDVDVVHVVGGGARNELLCQLTADACGLPVVAGPVEATALGNALVAARALGAVPGGLGDLRTLLRQHVSTRRYEPDLASAAAWDAAEARADDRGGRGLGVAG